MSIAFLFSFNFDFIAHFLVNSIRFCAFINDFCTPQNESKQKRKLIPTRVPIIYSKYYSQMGKFALKHHNNKSIIRSVNYDYYRPFPTRSNAFTHLIPEFYFITHQISKLRIETDQKPHLPLKTNTGIEFRLPLILMDVFNVRLLIYHLSLVFRAVRYGAKNHMHCLSICLLVWWWRKCKLIIYFLAIARSINSNWKSSFVQRNWNFEKKLPFLYNFFIAIEIYFLDFFFASKKPGEKNFIFALCLYYFSLAASLIPNSALKLVFMKSKFMV